MKFRYLILLLIVPGLCSCDKLNISGSRPGWEDLPDQVWAGPDFWANRLQDWKVENGRLVCVNPGPMRTVHLTTRAISEKRGYISASASVFRNAGNNTNGAASAGLLLGAGRGLDKLSASLVFHSWGESAGIFVGLDIYGNLFVRDFEKENLYLKYNKHNNSEWTEAHLVLKLSPEGNTYNLNVLAVNPFTNFLIDRLELKGLSAERMKGNIALVSHPGYERYDNQTFSFSNLRIRGSKIIRIPDGNIGPVVTSQYTLSKNTLKMTAQLMPVCESANEEVILELKENDNWKPYASSQVRRPSYTARFRFNNWNRPEDTEYRLYYSSGKSTRHNNYLYGIIKHDPVDKEEIRMISLSCIQQITMSPVSSWTSIDGGYFPYDRAILFPHKKLLANLKKQNADVIFFAGDQVYETSSPTSPDYGKNVYLDYLYKWYLWCLTFRDLTTSIPAITIPDDHDVYQSNLWGEGGKATPEGLTGFEATDEGGYMMPAEFVNMVQETQTGHLPDPYDPLPADQGISVYFTECNVGGLSLAILEDRKFKSAPKNLFPDAQIENGWPRNRNWNARYYSNIPNAVLLGERQLSFLDQWSKDWTSGTWMKAVLSQTPFTNLSTIPRDSLDDDVMPLMEIPDSGLYIEGDRLATDFDSNGWPQQERNKAINLFRKAFAIHVSGDQYLGSTVQYGIENFRDANFAIVSPATGNIWPKHWFPPNAGYNRKEDWPKNYGDFEDGFGNKITVFAVSNPHKSIIAPVTHSELSPGYSVIKFNRHTRDIELANWSYYADPDTDSPFPNWPVTIGQADNYGRAAAGWLPELRIEGMDNPVIRIIREFTGELIYSLRINGNYFQPKIFEMGFYRIEVGEPDEDHWQTFERIWPTEFKEREPLIVNF